MFLLILLKACQMVQNMQANKVKLLQKSFLQSEFGISCPNYYSYAFVGVNNW
jgi:hypothetical protein